MTTRLDNFLRADESPVTSPWAIMSATGITGSFDISGGELVKDGGGVDGVAYRTDSWGEAHSSEITLGGSASDTGPCVRNTAGGQSVLWYLPSGDIYVSTGSGYGYGGANRFNSYDTNGTYRLECDADGVTYRCFQNGVQVGADFTLSSMTGGTPGVEGYSAGDGCVRWKGTGAVAALTPAGTPVVQYHLDEAASGTAPTAILDASGNSYDLDSDVTYDGTMAFTEDAAGNRGLVSSDRDGDHRILKNINNTSDALRDALYDHDEGTIEVVLTLVGGNNNGGRIFGINDRLGGNGMFTLKANQNDDAYLGVAFAGADANSIAIGTDRCVIHVVFDSNEAAQDDRMKVYKDGELIWVCGTALGIGSGGVFSLPADLDLILFNRSSSGSYARSIEGTIGYAAMYPAALTPAQIDNNAALLLDDDDNPAVPSLVRYVNPASSGGDGTTNATSGPNAAYASLDACFDAEATALTGITCDIYDYEDTPALTIALDILLDGTTVDSTQAVLDQGGWVTDATHRVRIRMADGAAGLAWPSSRYRLQGDPGYGEGMLSVEVAINLDLDFFANNTRSLNDQPKAVVFSNVAHDTRVYGGIYWNSSTSGYNTNGRAIGNTGGTSVGYSFKGRNFVALCEDGAALGFGYADGAGTVLYLYNVTAIDRGSTGTIAAVTASGDNADLEFRAKNLLIKGPNCWECYNTDEALTILTTDATSPTSALRNKSIAFVDEDNEDFHLAAADTDAVNEATDLSSDTYWPFSVDADGTTRSSWDVGADEYEAGAITGDGDGALALAGAAAGTVAGGLAADQEGFRFFNDDNVEASATGAAPQDTGLVAPGGTNYRLRGILNFTGDPPAGQIGVEFRKVGGTYAPVPETP